VIGGGRGHKRRVLVVYSHPVEFSLVAAAKDRVLSSLEAKSHEVEFVDLYADDFDPRLSMEGWHGHLNPNGVDPEIAEYAKKLQWCDTLVLVYPTWYGAQPSMLKGWFDRVLTNGVAYHHSPGQAPFRPGLKNIRRIVVVTTHGSSKPMNSLQGEPGKRVVLRGLRSLCSPLCRSSWLALYKVDRCDHATRTQWLTKVEQSILAL
jgi:NAD(P)H dehydrogenase (quinone)